MDQTTHNKIVSFIWGIADDVLPMCVLSRMEAVLDPTKCQVLNTEAMLDQARISEQQLALKGAALGSCAGALHAA